MKPSLLASFLSRFLLAAVLILGATGYYDHSENARLLGNIKNKEMLDVGLGSSSLLRHLESIAGDLRFISQHFAMQQVVNNPASPETERLEVNFPTLLETKKVYDQLRWIDASGQEIVRADRSNGQPRLVPRNELQNKGDRYYFSDAMKMAAGQIYVSPLDLNIENGAIEVPHKPMLRLAMPVADRHGVKKGIVIINFIGKAMLDRFVADSGGGNGHVSLVNDAGYWLHAANPDDAWGFMFNDATRTLAHRYPASWARMIDRNGQFTDENGLWTFESVYPLLTELPDGASTNDPSQNQYRWLVVSHLERDTLAAMTSQGRIERWLLAVGLLLLSGLVILALLRLRMREQMEHERFRAIFDHAMVGIAMISPEKIWISVNPMLCHMLGYDAGELMLTDWQAHTHPDDLANDISNLEAVINGESAGYAINKRLIGKDGSIVHTAISMRAVRKPNGRVDFLVAIVEDISVRIVAEAARNASSNMLQRFIDHLPGSAYVKTSDSRLLLTNKGYQERFGVEEKEVLGRLSSELFPGELGEKIVADDARILATGVTECIEYSRDGRVFESIKFVIPRDDGSADLGGISMDVTERRSTELQLSQQVRRSAVLLELPKKAEELSEKALMQFALERAEELTQSIIAFMHFVNVDGETIELAAWSSSTLEKYCTAAFDNHYPLSEAGIWADAARQKMPVIVNDYANAPNKQGLPAGHSALTRLLSVPVLEEGEVRMMTGVGNKASDYTDFDVETVQLIGSEIWRIVCRQRSENALRLATQVVNASPAVCFRWAATDGWPVVFVSENVAQWGYKAHDLQSGKPVFADMVHPDDLQRIGDEVARHCASGATEYEQEYRILTAENRVIWVVDRTIVQRNDTGAPEFFSGVLTDITERRRQQSELNDALQQQKKLNKRLEEANNQLMQSEKMASIGQLAAGVAHELNNPIGFVHSNLGTLDGYVHDLMAIINAYDTLLCKTGETNPHDEEVRRLLEQHDFAFLKGDIFSLIAESKDGLGRVRKIVQDLKNFSRVGEQEWQEADLHQGIDSTLNIVWNELKYKAKVVKEYGDIPHAFCLISQLNQVFMNLLVNAGHAIETQGTITIRTSRHGDDSICVEISDTGKGIAPEHINRIFDPFFTTKPVGKGTGLGLSLSYGIVKRHGGRIEVESIEGQGTTFRLVLPITPPRNVETKDSETSK